MASQRIDPQRLRDVLDLAIAARRVQSDSTAAIRAGITPATLSNILAGRRDGSPDVQDRIAAALGVHLRTITTSAEHDAEEKARRALAAAAKKKKRTLAARKAA